MRDPAKVVLATAIGAPKTLLKIMVSFSKLPKKSRQLLRRLLMKEMIQQNTGKNIYSQRHRKNA
jgi:hypothetical protein